MLIRWAIVGFLLTQPAMARDFGQYAETPDYIRKWFNDLKQPDHRDFGCCSEADCRPVESKIKPDGSYQAKIEGFWVDVPNQKIERDPRVLQRNPLRQPIACVLAYPFTLDNEAKITVNWFCFEPWDELG